MNAIIKHPLNGELLSPQDTILVVSAMHPLKTAHDLVPVPTGSSIEEIVRLCGEASGVSRLSAGAHVSINGHIIPPELWHRVRVKTGAHVMVRAFPRGGSGGILRSVLQIALVIVASVFLPGIGTALGLGALGTTLLTSAVLLGGSYLLNSLFPPSQTKADERKQVYSIASRQNEAARWGPIPVMLGRQRIAPKYASSPYTEFVGDDQYLRMLFVWGQGPLDISDIRIGETSIAQFEDVEIQTLSGYLTDGQQTLYPAEVVQSDFNLETSSVDGPITRTSASDADEIVVDLVAPQGIIHVYTSDGSRNTWTVQGTIEILHPVTGAVIQSQNWNFTAKTNDPIRRSYRFTGLPGGAYDVRVTRTTPDDREDQGKAENVVWTALKTFRKSPPIEYHKPLAITALRIRATKQLNGAISDLTAIVASRAKSWNGASWADNQPTRNPADLFRLTLQGPGNARPVPDSRLDLPAIEAWAEFCAAKGFTFDMYRDFKSSVRETLADICAAGRAVPIFRDGLWSVAMEDVFAPTVQHFTPRNSSNFTWTQAYQHLPHALRVKFLNADKDWIEDERIVYDDGYSAANATLFEQVEFPGVTNPELVFKHARYRMAERKLRAALYRVTVDFEHLICTRGDRVHVAHDVIQKGLAQGRIRAVAGNVVTLDEKVTMVAGHSYGMRVRRADGSSVVLAIASVAGEHHAVTFTGAAPAPGDLFMFGLSGQETGIYRILAIRPGEDFSAEIDLVDDAPGISIADNGPIIGDPGVVITPTPLVQMRPRSLALSTKVALRGGVAARVSRLIWTMPFGPDVAAFEVVGTLAGGATVTATADAASPHAEFLDLDLGIWSFVVRAILTDGRATPFSLPLVVEITATTAALGSVVGLTLVNAFAPGQFAGTDAEFSWSHTWAAHPSATAGSNPLYAGNIVRVFDVATGQLLREEPTTEARYVYTIAKNTDDSARLGRHATRNLRIEVAVVDVYGGMSAFVSVTASNPPPEAITPTITQGFGLVHLKWALPPDPDIAGVLVWSSVTSGFNPYATEPFYQGLGTGTVVPVPIDQPRFVRIAAYDAFGIGDLNFSQELEVTSLDPSTVIDVEAPDMPLGFDVTSTLDAAGMASVIFTWSANTEDDLSHYRLRVSLNGGGQTTLLVGGTSYTATVLPGTAVTPLLQAVDNWGNVSAPASPTPSTHIAAADSVPPAVPIMLPARSAFRTAWFEWVANTEADLARYEFHWNLTGATPAIDAPFNVTAANTFMLQGEEGQTISGWVRARDTSDNVSAWSAVASTTTSSAADIEITTEKLAGLIDRTSVASGLALVELFADGLPTTGNFEGRTAGFQGKLWRFTGGVWTATVPAADVSGQFLAHQIAANQIQTVHFEVGAVKAEQIDARAITSKHLLIRDANNLILNSEFSEGADGLDGWHVRSGDVQTYDGVNAPGRRVLRLNSPTGVEASVVWNDDVGNFGGAGGGVTCSPGDEFYFECYVWWTGGQPAFFADFYQRQASDEAFSNAGAVGSPVPAQTWTKVSGSFETTVHGRLYARLINNVSGTQIFYTKADLRRKNKGELVVDGTIKGRHLFTEDLITLRAQIGDAVIDDAHVANMSAAKLLAGTALAGSITVDGQYALGDPAAGVNAGTTKILPGQIQISAGFTLNDWRMGSGTEINGFYVAANTIRANSLVIGVRGVDVLDVQFDTNRVDTVTWTAGYVEYANDAGDRVSVYVQPGSHVHTTASTHITCVWYDRVNTPASGHLAAAEISPAQVLSNSNNVILAVYRGGINLVANYGRTIVDGAGIKANTVTAAQLDVISARAAILDVGTLNAIYAQAGTLVVTDAAYFNQLTANAAFIANVKAGVLTAGSVTTDMLRVGNGKNLVRNADFKGGFSHWSYNVYWGDGSQPPPTQYAGILMNGHPERGVFGENVVHLYQSNAHGDIMGNLISAQFAVAAGQRYEFSMYVGGFGMGRPDIGYVLLAFFDFNGNFTGIQGVAYANDVKGAYLGIGDYTRVGGFVTAPANAHRAYIAFYKYGSYADGANLWLARPMVAEALPHQTALSPWAASAQTTIGPGYLEVSGADYSGLPVGGTNMGQVNINAVNAYNLAAVDPAARVNAGSTNITGNRIRTGVIVSETGKMIINLNAGVIEIYD